MFQELYHPPVCVCGWIHRIRAYESDMVLAVVLLLGGGGALSLLLWSFIPAGIGVAMFVFGLIGHAIDRINECPECQRRTLYNHEQRRCVCGYRPVVEGVVYEAIR